jgi:hypothetical protein
MTSRNKSLVTVPKNWRSKLPEQVGKLPFTSLSSVLSDASAILKGYSNAEVQQIAHDLQHLIAKPGTLTNSGTDEQGLDVDPRIIYCHHANATNGLDFVVFRDQLAVAILLEVARACDLFSEAHDLPFWVKATQAITNARALSEWIYMIHTLAGDGQAGKFATPQDIRTAVKAKTKKAKSEAAKKGWRKTYKVDKQLVIDHYEQHKTAFKSLAHAADEITKKKLVPLNYSTIYTWLLKHAKKAKN